eukprot:NODE_122_length_17689_cov_1.046219.p7 type:complete len:198 gc:universal NODE_122_length_17689_cov_1.046219:7662-7069(-)
MSYLGQSQLSVNWDCWRDLSGLIGINSSYNNFQFVNNERVKSALKNNNPLYTFYLNSKQLNGLGENLDSIWYVQNPVLSNNYCCERINKMIKFITTNGYSGYAIKHNFRKYEFQHRGTVHCHLFLWLNDTNVSSEMLFTDLLNSISGGIPDYNDDPMLFYIVYSRGAYCTSMAPQDVDLIIPKLYRQKVFLIFKDPF